MNLSDSIKNLKNKIEDINTKVTKLIESSNLANAKAKDNETKVENVINTTDNNLKNINENMKKINIINDKLKTSQSLEYDGENITCENILASRTSDMLIKGQTYQNLFRRIDSQTTQEKDNNYILTGVANVYSMLSIYPAYNLSKNNKYTVIIDVKNLNVPDGRPFKFDGFNGNTWVCGTKIETTGLKKILLQGNQDITEIRLQINNGINCNITVSKNIIILKGDWTNKEVPTSITGIESAGQKENKISILSKNNKSTDYKEDKKEILLPVNGGLKSLPNDVYDTIEERSDGVYLVQRIKKETYVNGDENNDNYLTDKVNTYKPLQTPVETKLDIQNLDLEVYKDITYITTDNAIKPTLSFKVPSNIGSVMQGNAQNINKLYKYKVDKVDGKSLVDDAEISRLSKISNYDDSSIKTSIANINSKLDTKANKSELFSGSYNALTNKPSINGVTLTGDKSLSDLGIDLSRYTTTDKAVTSIELVDAIPTGSTGTTTEKCLRLTFADGTTVVNVSVNDLVGSDEKQKAIVCIVDDDGTNRTSDAYTGMTTWLNDKGIPMNFAICHDTVGTSGKYTVTELQELQANGNDILVHGNPKLTTLADETEVVEELQKAIKFHTDNNLTPTNVYVYPQGLNSDGTLTATQVKEIVGRYFDYALNVNIASMSGEDTRGLWNKAPLVDKLNIARMEVSSTKGFDANKSKIDACIENKGLLILFTHSFQSQFTSGGYDEFQKIINYLSTQDVEFLTVSKALDKVEKIVKNYDDTQVKADIADLQNNKVDKTSILSTISSNPSDDKLLSEKAIYDALLNNSSICDDSETEKYFHNTSAHEFVNMLSPAVNLGNTLDCHLNTEHPTAPDTIIGWETLWNNVETTKKIMEAYKKVGFKAIRIPITWHEHMGENGSINSEWLVRVKTIVDWAIESGLIVIINTHHDTNEGNYINAVTSDYETSKAHLINIWTQVGEYFADYDNRLVFESMNECLNPNLSDKWHGDAESFKVINKLNQVFVNTVRSQAWNRNRFLLVPTYAAGTSTEITSAFIMPIDNVKDKLIVEVHTYNTTIGKIKSAQASVRANLIERGFPVFLGEYGVRPSEVTDETERLNLLQLQTKMFREMGAGVCIWDNGNGSYKLLNRKTYAFYYPDIVNGIIKSSNKHDFVKLPYLDESYNIKDISNWKEGKIGHSDGEYDSTGTHYFTSDQHLIPRYSSYIVSMNDHSNDRLLVVHRDKNMKMIGGVETKTNGGTITISANDRYIDFCYYNKSTTSTLTKEQFAEYINNGYLQINKADGATQNFEIIEQPLNEALIDLDKRIGNGVDLTGYATVDYVDRQIASVSTGGTTAVNAPEPEYFENLNATQVLEKISPGINLGNTLDSWDSYKHPDRTPIDWETSWHNVETTKEILKCYKDKGFKTLRIPITWFVHMDDSGVINSEWLTRVKQIVDWTLELGMNVIINVHHDTNEGDYISATPSKQDQSVANLINIWNQVGVYFSNYDYRVLFECMNECLDLTLGNSAKWDGTEDAYKVINVLNQAFVKTIRRQEGNKNRFLIVPTYACSAFEAQTNAFKLPYDPSNRLIVELHNYNKSIPEINKLIYPIFKNFTSKGIPVLMGEFGITESNISDLTERTKMIKYYVQTIRELGCGVCYWDGGDYSILDRENKSWKYDNYSETILSIANHYRIYNTESFENADLNDINLWAVGKHSSSTGVVNYYATQNMACRFYFKPTHTEYTINTDDSSLDRFNVVQLADDFTFISNTKVNPGTAFTIDSNCKYIGLSYYKKDATTGSPTDITIESFGANLSNKTIEIIPSGDLLGKNDISLTKEQANEALNRALGTYGIDYFS